jgi:hypothetical protein
MGKTRKQKRIPQPGPSQCHPRVGDTRPEEGCIPSILLQRAAQKLNMAPVASPVRLRKKLESALEVPPNQEYTFVNALPFSEAEKEYITQTYLRPPRPATWVDDPDMWLDSLNIEAVMKQYEEAYPDFEFMGPYPIDFAAPDPYAREEKCLIREMCALRIQQAMEKGTKHIGIVYNLDPHFKDGSHWIANFIDLPRHKCYYFDSYGMKPPNQVEKFMKWLTTQDPKMKLAYNARRFQFKGSECGVYCLYFIIRMLKGDRFQPFCRKAPRDAAMLDLRDDLFSI